MISGRHTVSGMDALLHRIIAWEGTTEAGILDDPGEVEGVPWEDVLLVVTEETGLGIAHQKFWGVGAVANGPGHGFANSYTVRRWLLALHVVRCSEPRWSKLNLPFVPWGKVARALADSPEKRAAFFTVLGNGGTRESHGSAR